ncbi:MAG: winged helix-turn-helix domain-containing protein [Terracidiphilus sp.]|jgi:DNA-binding winged helix-turn-helix (wHTH) protein/tetratricopeptide (TPR) repeat protein
MSTNFNSLYRFEGFELDTIKRTVARNGERVIVSPKAFEVLVYLVMNPGRLVTKEELMKAVWPDSFVEEGNLAQHISSLRKAFGDKPDLIVTTPGRGYRFAAMVEQHASGPSFLEAHPGQLLVQTVRERTHIVVEETAPASMAPVPVFALPAGHARIRWNRIYWIGAMIVALALVAGTATYLWQRFANPPQLRKLVVAEFINSTGDDAFNSTLKRALEIDLGQSPYMDVMSEGEAVRTLQLMGRERTSAFTPDVAKEACVRSNRQVLVTGNIANVGREYLLTLEATDCNSGKRLSSAKAEAESKEKVLAALDSVARHVRAGLGESRVSIESFQVPIEQATTTSLEALKWYSEGYYLNAQEGTDRLPFFQKAVELDPQFAMAYASMATIYYNQSEFRLATQYYQKAFDLSSRVSEREKIVIQAHYYAEGRADLEKGIQTYRLWAETYPHDWAPWINLADEYTQLGQYPSAITAARQALEMEPKAPINSSVLARACRRAGRYAEAKTIGQQAIDRNVDSTGLHATLFDIASAENDRDALARETRWAQDHPDAWYRWYFVDRQAEAAISAGKYQQAKDLFRRSYEIAQSENLPEAADDVLLDEAQREFALGMPAASRSTLEKLGKADQDSTEYAVLQAEFGNTLPGEHYLAAHADSTHLGTVQAFIDLPLVRAALALQRGKPLDAVAALEPAAPYELATYDVLAQRGEAYLVAKQAEMAANEFRKILANPGIDPLLIQYPLAHLGLARAYVLQNKTTDSRNEYKKFFALWKDADPDVPVLKQARLEYTRLK